MKALVFSILLLASSALGMSPSKLQVLANSTVRIETPTGFGSGTVVSTGHIITCAHVVAGQIAILVETLTHDGKAETMPAHVLKVDTKHDLALLYVKGLTLPAIRIAKSDAEEFATVYSINAPLGKQRTVSMEILNLVDEAGLWRLTGPSMKGSSGGGIFDENGELQCVYRAQWNAKDMSYGVMGQCVDRKTVLGFLK